MLPLATTVPELRTSLFPMREKGESVALVPTMGALHKGHLTLVSEAKKAAKRVVVSIFVNPLQFGPKEDFAAYPRQMDADKKLLADAGCDLLYAPTAEAMYPQDFAAKIDPGALGTILEGSFRPGHFMGVATVVAKLLLQTLPDAAFFGQKDYQQLLVINRITRDLDIPVHIVGVPTVREDDGLALSSRNAYLSPEERKTAVTLPNTMKEVIAKIKSGAVIEQALAEGLKKLEAVGFKPDYLECADPNTLQPVRETGKPARLLTAARLGKTRLIDNIAV
jgi:pantoate--beta-alanine ligase